MESETISVQAANCQKIQKMPPLKTGSLDFAFRNDALNLKQAGCVLLLTVLIRWRMNYIQSDFHVHEVLLKFI